MMGADYEMQKVHDGIFQAFAAARRVILMPVNRYD